MRRIALILALLCLSACTTENIRAIYTDSGSGGLWVWEANTATRLLGTTPIERARLSDDGRYIAALTGDALILVDTYGPQRTTLLTPGDIQRLGSNAVWFWWVPGQPTWLAYYPIERINRATGEPASLWIMDVVTGQRWEVLQESRASLRFSPLGDYVSVKTSDGLNAVSLTGDATHPLMNATTDDMRVAIQWVPDATGLLTVGPQVYRGSFLSRPMTITRLGIDGTRTPLATLESRPAQLSLSPDATHAATIADKWLILTDLTTGSEAARFRSAIESRTSPQWSPDSRGVLYFDTDHTLTLGTTAGTSTPITTDTLAGDATIHFDWLNDEHIYIVRRNAAGDHTWHYVVQVGGAAALIVDGQPHNVDVVAP